MSQQERALLLSVRPCFAESIMNGSKVAEIRRQRPSIEPGTPVIIYATQPVAAVVGTARLSEVHHGPPDDVWSDYHSFMGVTHEEFDEYLAGAAAAYILMLADVRRLETPLTLSEMRATSGFHPPRSYRYITRASLSVLVNGHPCGDVLLSLLPARRARPVDHRNSFSSGTAESSLFLSRRRRKRRRARRTSAGASGLGRPRPRRARRASHTARHRSHRLDRISARLTRSHECAHGKHARRWYAKASPHHGGPSPAA